MQDRRPGQCGLPDVAGDLRIQFAEAGQDGQAAPTQNARSQPQSNRAHLSQAPPLVLLKPSRLILVARIDQHHSGHVTVLSDRETDVRVSDLVFGDAAAALREHGSTTLRNTAVTFAALAESWSGGHRNLRVAASRTAA